jgi:predicted ATPase
MATVDTDPTNEEVDEWTKPPFLRRVRIRGYKSIAFCDVELQPLTILVGRNAAGKSNFVNALMFFRDIVSVGLNEAVKRHGGRDTILCRYLSDSRVRIEVDFSFAIPIDPILWAGIYIVEAELAANGPAHIIFERLTLNDSTGKLCLEFTNENGNVMFSTTNYPPNSVKWRNKDRPFLTAYHDTPLSEFSDYITSMTAYNFYPEAIRRLQQPTPGLHLEQDGSNLASVIESTREMDPETINRVSVYLSAVVDEVDSFWPVRYGEYETVRFRIRSRHSQEPLEFDAASMSDGTLRTLAALVAVFQLLSAPRLVCIEEPETSLHPAAMRALVDALDEATGRTQILLSTHSAEILDNPTIRPENILVVQMREGQTVIGPVDEAYIEIVRRKLNTLGGLERENQLEPDIEDRDRQQRLAQAGQEPVP